MSVPISFLHRNISAVVPELHSTDKGPQCNLEDGKDIFVGNFFLFLMNSAQAAAFQPALLNFELPRVLLHAPIEHRTISCLYQLTIQRETKRIVSTLNGSH